MKTKIEKIIADIESLKTLEDCTLEEMEAELTKTSECVVVEVSELKEAKDYIIIKKGKIGVLIESASRRPFYVECSFRKMVEQSIRTWEDIGTDGQFVKDARNLASMLLKAAIRVERDYESTPPS